MIAGSYWYNGTQYPGPWSDQDNDAIPDAQDSMPNDWWNGAPHFSYQGTDYAGEWQDRDFDNTPDVADAYPDDPDNNADSDSDGISNYAERTQLGTDPSKADTDDDLLTDFEELYTYHTNPLLAKTNPNQLYSDYYLVDQTDSDHDQIPDRIEQWYATQDYGMNANDPNDALGDLDGDGYTNRQAYLNGWSLIAHLIHYDHDADGILDVLEDVWAAQYPNTNILSSSNPDDAAQDFDNDGVMNFEEIALGLNPGAPNSRITGVYDLQEWAWRGIIYGTWNGYNGSVPAEWNVVLDNDNSGAPDGLEAFAAALTATPELVALPQRVAADDYDGDGMSDVWEHRYNFNLRDAADANANNDGDSLTNLAEFQQNRDPLINDDPVPPQIVTTNLPDGIAGTAYNATIEAQSGTAPYSFVVSTGSLPDGLSLDGNGNLSGTPSTAGNSSFTVSVTDQAGLGGTRDFTMNVSANTGGGGMGGNTGGGGPPPLQLATTTLPPGGISNFYTATIQASGGTGTYTFSSTGGLPAGMSMSETGVLSGTPTVAGEFDVAFQINDGTTSLTAQSLHLSIADLTITTETLPSGTVYAEYSATISVVNGTAPYMFSLVEGSLPFGYMLASDGAITGAPDSTGSLNAGTFTFAVQVADNLGRTATKQLSIMLSGSTTTGTDDTQTGAGGGGGGNNTQAVDPNALVLLASDMGGTKGSSFSAQISASGGVLPYSFSCSLPSGLSIDSETGRITGTPSYPGKSTVTAQVTDGIGTPASKTINIDIADEQQNDGTNNDNQGEDDDEDDTGTETTQDNNNNTVATKAPEVVSVSFKSAPGSNQEMNSPIILTDDDGANPYSEPHWESKSAGHHYPVAYVAGAYPYVEVEIDPGSNGQNVSGDTRIKCGEQSTLKLHNSGANGIVLFQTSGNKVTVNLEAFSNEVGFYNADEQGKEFTLEWEIKRPGDSDFVKAGTTRHTVYVVNAKPKSTAEKNKQESLYNISCRSAKGQSTAAGILSGIWAEFNDCKVYRAQYSSGSQRPDPMTYWGAASKTPSNPTSSVSLLKNADGRCGDWCCLYIDCLRLQGIDADIQVYKAPPGNLVAMMADGNAPFGQKNWFGATSLLFVKNWTPLNQGTDRFRYQHNGIKCQGAASDPRGYFSNHALVLFNGQLYDPSYGLIHTAANNLSAQANWETNALSGFGMGVDVTTDLLGTSFAKWFERAKTSSSAETIFDPTAKY